jgi:hypothetical protein
MLFGPKMLPDDAVIAVIKSAMSTLSMETEGLGFPALCFDNRLVPMEAFYRGLLEGFVLGVLNAKGLISITSGANISFSSRSRKVFDDAIEKSCMYGSSIDTHTNLFWKICYEVSKLQWSRELFNKRLQSAMFQEKNAYEIGKEVALYQVSIAHTGMIRPTKKLQIYIADLEKDLGHSNGHQ